MNNETLLAASFKVLEIHLKETIKNNLLEKCRNKMDCPAALLQQDSFSIESVIRIEHSQI